MNSFAWNTILSASCGQQDSLTQVLALLDSVPKHLKDVPNKYSLNNILNACSEFEMLSEGRVIFSEMKQRYGVEPNSFHYGCMMKLLVKLHHMDEALMLLGTMKKTNVEYTPSIFTILLNGCVKQEHLKLIHTTILHSGVNQDIVLKTALAQAYFKFGDVTSALELLGNVIYWNLITFNSVIKGLGNNGRERDALDFFEKLQQQAFKPDDQTITCILNACGQSNLVKEAQHIFYSLNQPKRIHYGCMIKVFVNTNMMNEALKLVEVMNELGVPIDHYSLTLLLNGCANLGLLDVGMKLHKVAQTLGATKEVMLVTSLIDMYFCCKKPQIALDLFERITLGSGIKVDNVLWNTVIMGLGNNKMGEKALEIYERMQQQGFKPDDQTITCILNACGQSNLVKEAQHIFCSLNQPTPIQYGCMVNVFTINNMMNEAMKLVEEMDERGIPIDQATYNSLLTGCCNNGFTELGMKLYYRIEQEVSKKHPFLVNSQLNLLLKSGNSFEALNFFHRIPKDTISDNTLWNIMIDGLGDNGMGREALNIFNSMQDFGVEPDEKTFTCILNACSHSNMLNEALEIFNSLSHKYHIEPTLQLQSCIADAYARQGLLDQAEKFILNLEKTDTVIWGTLLSACRHSKDVIRAERIFKIILSIDPNDTASYVLMANIYAASGKTKESLEVIDEMQERGLHKIPGKTFVELNGKMYEFTCEDTTHPQTKEIMIELEKLNQEILDAGYEPDTTWVTKKLKTEEEKKKHLCKHSERIAMAFLFLNTPRGTRLTMTKNLRICRDCHSATKFISKVRQCEIVLRDANRYHVFKDGKCSCGDKW